MWTWASERALLRRFDDADVGMANRRALALHRLLRGQAFAEIEDAIPGARTLLVALRPGMEPSRALLDALDADVVVTAAASGATHELRARYDGADLAALAHERGLTADQVIEMHTAATYTVAFLGFSPGFPYLLGLPEPLHAPRLATPRTSVPAGSVAIGGGFTGIYPRATPGGWRLIATLADDVALFDPARDPVSLLAPGDRVRFVPA